MNAVYQVGEPNARYLAAIEPPLLSQFDLIAQAPNGVARLRELILTLAVQGKLVQQDPNDEPASALLERIRAEKARLVKEGKIRRVKLCEMSPKEESSFCLPKTWKSVRIHELCELVTDGEHATPQRTEDKNAIPLVTAKNVRNGFMDYLNTDYVPLEVAEQCWRRCKPQLGDILMVSVGATLGRLSVLTEPRDMVLVRSVTLFRPLGLDANYLALHLRSLVTQTDIWASVKQSAQPCLYLDKSSELKIAVPPLAEQSRIVARVEELIALCDALEAKGKLEAEQHARLVGSLFESLANSESAHALAENWQRIATHFDLLLDRPAAVDALEQAILQLAVRGLLVPQDPADEPASALLQKIRAEKDRLIATGQLKRDKPLPPISDEEAPFKLPEGWEWASFGNVSINRDGERIPVSSADRERRDKIYDYYGASGVIDKIDGYLFDSTLLLIGEDGANLINRSTPVAFLAHGKYWVNNHAHVIDTTDPGLMDYLCLFINAISLEPYVTGTAQPKMNQAKLNSILVALPPLAEQSRIVARVADLRALCAQLRDKLAAAAQTQSRLAATLIEKAVA